MVTKIVIFQFTFIRGFSPGYSRFKKRHFGAQDCDILVLADSSYSATWVFDENSFLPSPCLFAYRKSGENVSPQNVYSTSALFDYVI